MATKYTIYLVNNSLSNQTFWCFLQQPDDLAADPAVFANSSANLTVRPKDSGLNSFTIPVQYKVGAGSSNNAVGLNVKVNTMQSSNADLTNWLSAEYVTVPPKMGPTLKRLDQTAPDDMIFMTCNEFDQAINESNSWYASMSFGIQTDSGFIGMSWAPEPGKTTKLKPKLSFYISVGSYDTNTLADFTTVSNSSCLVSVPVDFSLQGEVTVVYRSNGSWTSYPGPPKPTSLVGYDYVNELIESHLHLSRSHSELIGLLTQEPNLSMGGTAEPTEQQDTIDTVKWTSGEVIESETGIIKLFGTLTVNKALAAGFTSFLLSGVKFNISGSSPGVTSFNFNYDGSLSANYVKGLFSPGSKITLK